MESPIKLSILICSLKSRKESFEKLIFSLYNQNLQSGLVEILNETDSGEISIGRKRNRLVSRALGEYVAFIDDDDTVDPDYIRLVLQAIETAPDCVGIVGTIPIMGVQYLFKHSIQYQGWYTNGSVFYRTPNHLNPVKRSKVQAIPFPDINFGEDKDYSLNLRMKLKTEVMIQKPIYFYAPAARDQKTGAYI